MNSIVISSSNVVSGSNNNTYQYSFPSNFNFKGKEVALTTASIPYSWFNITSKYNNNSFTITWIDSTTSTLTFPDGNYAVSDLNTYLEAFLISKGWYLIDNSTSNAVYHYYLSFQSNAPLYAIQLTSLVLPATLPTGWAYPAGATWTTSSTNPQITILALTSNLFGNVVGFTAGIYPSNNPATNYTHNSDYTPQVDQVTSIVLSCNIVDNPYSIPAQILATIPLSGSVFGSYIVPSLGTPLFTRTIGQWFQTLQLRFFDQSGNALLMNDDSITIQLSIRDTESNNLLKY